jgi:hypothetical protein
MTGSMKYILGLLLLCTVFSGCKTKMAYVPAERTKIEYRDRYMLDSVFYRDTVNIFSRGDTVYNTEIKWRERYKFVRDTINVTDTIPVIVEKEVPVNYLTRWQKNQIADTECNRRFGFGVCSFQDRKEKVVVMC